MTEKEIDQAYSNEAMQLGHKTYIVSQLSQEIEAHKAQCKALCEQKDALLATKLTEKSHVLQAEEEHA